MSKKIKALIAVGGTGGHVLPGCNLAKHLIDKNYEVNVTTDQRGYKFLRNYKNLNVSILPSSPLIKSNLFRFLVSLSFIFYSIIKSLIFLISNRPSIIFGMGGYSSFPICIAATLLRVKFIIYENNLIIGKANKYLLPFADKILISYNQLEGISKNYENKIFEIGNIIKKEIINFSDKNSDENKSKTLKILILGGSQAAKIFAEKLPNIFKKCSNDGIDLKIFQHCLPNQHEVLKKFYANTKINFESFDFSENLTEYFTQVDFAITRSGSSMLAELTNLNIPFLSIPLPSSADNHQYKNAVYYKEKNFSFLIEEKDLDEKLFYLIKDVYENSSILDKIRQNQRQYSDKNVYDNIDQVLNKITNEEN